MKERSQSRSVVEAYIWPNQEPCQELSYLEGCHPHIPRGQIHGVCERQLKRWATVWSVDLQSGQEGSLTHPTGYRVAVGSSCSAGPI